MHVESEEEFDRFLSEGTYTHVLVDFYADWCGPCKRFAPTFEKLKGEYSKVLFLKVDVDELDNLAQRYDVSAMPTFLLIKTGSFKNEDGSVSLGKLLSSVRGANEPAVRNMLDSL
jgi:thioredoxin 1